MSEVRENACFDCDYFTKAVGEKGYCKLFHHETALPEKACPRYEEKKDVIPEPSEHAPEAIDPPSRRFINLLLIGSFFSSTVLAVLAFIIVLIYTVTVMPLADIPMSFKLLTVAAGIFAVLLFTYILFTLSKKYAVARILEIVLTLIISIVFLLYFNQIIFNVHSVIISVIEKIFTLFA